MLGAVRKQPGERLDYDIDFTKWMTDGDVLALATAAADDASLTVEAPQVIPPLVKVWISGGNAGKSYKVTVTVTTADGRVKTVNFNLRVSEC